MGRKFSKIYFRETNWCKFRLIYFNYFRLFGVFFHVINEKIPYIHTIYFVIRNVNFIRIFQQKLDNTQIGKLRKKSITEISKLKITSRHIVQFQRRWQVWNFNLNIFDISFLAGHWNFIWRMQNVIENDRQSYS